MSYLVTEHTEVPIWQHDQEEISKIPEELASLANEWMRELKPKKEAKDE